MKLGIRFKLFLVSLLLIGISVLTAEIYLSNALEHQLTERIRGDLLVRARLIAQRVAASGVPFDEDAAADALADELGRAAGVRVTLVRNDGRVAGDSEVELTGLPQVESHGTRPEVLQALQNGQGSSIRYSTTVGRRMMYAAVPMSRQNSVIGTARVAVPLTDIDDAVRQIRKTLGAAALLALTVAAIVSYWAAELISRKLRGLTQTARRMAGGNLARGRALRVMTRSSSSATRSTSWRRVCREA